MNTPFGRPFEQLELADLQQCFAELRVEGLSWDATGGQIRRPAERRPGRDYRHRTGVVAQCFLSL
jgi:hypothetical protein